MPLRRLFIGPFQPRLEDALGQAHDSLRDRDCLASIHVLVPSHVLGRHLMRLLARGRGVCFNVRFVTFPGLAEAVGIERIVASRRIPLPGMADYLIARKAITTRVGADSYLWPILQFPRTPRTVLATLTDLKKAGVAPEHLASASKTLRELAEIYREVERLKEDAGYFDESDQLTLAADSAASSPALRDAAAVCLYGFADLNVLERRFFAACIDERPAYAFVPEDVAGHATLLVKWLESLGFEHEQLLERSQAVHPAVSFVSAPGVSHEVQAIAREVLIRAAAGSSFSDAAVLLRNPSEYERTVRDVFDAAGIPYVFIDGIPAAETLAGRLLRLLMRVRLGDYPRPEMMEFLELAPLHQRLLKDHPTASPADWDRYSREAGIVAGRNHWRRLPDLRRRVEWRIGRLQKESAGEPDQAALAVLQRDVLSLRAFERVANLLLKRLGSIPDQGTVGALMGGLIRALASVARLVEGDRAIVKTLADIAKQSVADEVVSLETFETLLEDLLAERIPPSGVYRSGRVTVGSLRGALGLPFKVVFIPGLVERSFPPPPRQDPIMLDHEREGLNAAVDAELMTRGRRAAEEQFYFWHALRAAGEAATLTFPRLDAATGHVRVPSHFLLRAAEQVTGAPAGYDTLERLASRVPLSRFESATPLTAGEWGLSSSVRALADRSPARLAGLPGLAAIVRGTTAEANRWGKRAFTGHDGMLGVAVAVPVTLSATQLETYGLCPFKFYGSRILGVQAIDEPEAVETLTALDRGSIIHEILERCMSALAKDGLLPFDRARVDEYRRRLEQTARDVFCEFERSGSVGYPFMWKVEQQRILTDLQAWFSIEVSEGEGFVPAFFEARFGPSLWGAPAPGSSSAPLDLDAGGRRLRLTGFVDRIDLHPAGRARVIDYKSGAVYNERPNLFRGGQSLQLPIYILAADQMLRDNGHPHTAEEAQYFYVTSKGRFQRIAFTRQALQERRAEFQRILQTMAEGMATGVFPQNPDGGENCRWCDFTAVCGHGRSSLVERKIDDPTIRALRSMWEVE